MEDMGRNNHEWGGNNSQQGRDLADELDKSDGAQNSKERKSTEKPKYKAPWEKDEEGGGDDEPKTRGPFDSIMGGSI